ncbi:UPF0223 family protein [Salibacterium halotolerans]|uniref:Uncharacterized protein YktA, UPF0223 family n=1 Tax=Salibacterium halotolerans TaxID=1884432 RepID=A0A1I5LYZ9_9BACI|nr:UPF0223 family protein [Salibacterium halotolerans]SFP02588.1 Uncharacterized protein YktA, UPF0223 family [Salibacterium halotolerans]
MEEEYPMPFSLEWTKEEIIDVMEFFQVIEEAYEKPVRKETVLAKYRRFKQIVPSKSEEKQYFRDFDEKAAVSCWKTVQQAEKQEAGEAFKMI